MVTKTAQILGDRWSARHEHRTFDGLTVPSKRRVKARDPVSGGPLPGILLIWADVHEYNLV